VAWRSLFLLVMQNGEPLPSRRGRRILIALLILLLILLPLYLWPLRGGLGGLPGASAVPGSVHDPRSAAAVARIPGDVWDALMGHVDALPPSLPPTKPPRNLTMIIQAEEFPGVSTKTRAALRSPIARRLARAACSLSSAGHRICRTAPPEAPTRRPRR
jgi:hypothetical protein